VRHFICLFLLIVIVHIVALVIDFYRTKVKTDGMTKK